MADAFLQLAPDSTGKMIDASSLNVGANLTHRQRINLADPTTAAALASVLNAAPGSTEYGITSRIVGLPAAVTLAEGEANPTLTQIAAFLQNFNGTTWDRQRNGKGGYSIDGTGVMSVWANAIQRKTYVVGAILAPAAFAAGTAKDIFSIFHPSASAIVARLRRCIISVYTNSVAGSLRLELYRCTAAGTGTSFTAQPVDLTDGATACTVLNNLTVSSTIAGTPIAEQAFGSLTTTPANPPVVLYDWQEGGETKTPTMRALTAEGYALRATHSAAATFVGGIQLTFTEE